MSVVSRTLGRRTVANLETVDREEYERIQTAAISKAINTQECAVKEKHIRTAILGTHREKGAGSFWHNVGRLQIEGSPILSWKFCHVLHKLMRDGNPHVLSDSLKYRSKITDLGKLWGHLKEGYGPLIRQYCKLLLTKLEFHYRNPGIPGNLLLTDEQLEAVGAQDVNNWYQLAVEMLDYLDDILGLQRLVFNSLDMSRASSMTPSGQCRLAPLILCILDSSNLYDYLVKMLFKLHATCAPDVLDGHRDRFNTDFKSLKQFYYSSSNLQYFKYLVSIPPLPDSPPNFLVASDFDNYVTPEVRIHDNASEAGWDTPPDNRSLADSQLIDVSDTPKQDKDKLEMELAERDQIINTLRHDLGDTKEVLNRLQAQSSNLIQQLQMRILQLEKELMQAKELIEQLSEENERYRTQAEQLQNEKNQQTAAKLEESERKAQNTEEKLKKMKDVYTKLRDEHIDTLKKLGTLQKESDSTKRNAEEAMTERQLFEARLMELQLEHNKAEEKVQQSSSKTENLLSELQETKLLMDRMKLELEGKLSTTENELLAQTRLLNSMKSENDGLVSKLTSCGQNIDSILRLCCIECGKVVDDTLEQFDNPAHLGVTSTPEFLLTRTGPCFESLELLKIALTKANSGNDESYNHFTDLIVSLVGFTPILSEILLNGKATSNIAPSNQIEVFVNICKSVGLKTKQLFHLLETKDQWKAAEGQFTTLRQAIEELESASKILSGKMADVSSDELGDLFEKEMKMMDAAVQQAAAKIQEMMAKSQKSDTGVRLDVNSKILDSCTALMMAVMELIHKARDLQNEIVQQGRGTGSVTEFYKRHHQWTEGLLSAAKAVGVGAQVLVNAADRVISGDGKFEELMAASQEVAASTAQLVVASKVKADRGSARLSALSSASKSVTSATANVLGTVKSGRETLEEKESMDFSNLSLHQAKRLEMEVQVKVLELESALEKERVKLAEVRKRHYQLAGPSAGWEEDGKS